MTVLDNLDTDARARRRGRFAVALGAILGAAGLAYVGIADPGDPSAPMPLCPLHAVTGLNCPGCGGLRMTHDLVHGDLAGAFAHNAVLLLLAPVLLVLLGVSAVRRVQGRRASLDSRITAPLLALALAWFAARNLGGW